MTSLLSPPPPQLPGCYLIITRLLPSSPCLAAMNPFPHIQKSVRYQDCHRSRSGLSSFVLPATRLSRLSLSLFLSLPTVVYFIQADLSPLSVCACVCVCVCCRVGAKSVTLKGKSSAEPLGEKEFLCHLKVC